MKRYRRRESNKLRPTYRTPTKSFLHCHPLPGRYETLGGSDPIQCPGNPEIFKFSNGRIDSFVRRNLI